jgi:uncharacterized membrane protein
MNKENISSYINIIPVAMGIIFSAFAQVCMKKATNIDVKTLSWFFILFISLLCYAISFLSYYFALKNFPISKVGPVMTVGVVSLVVLFGAAMGEVITLKILIGLILSIFSIILIMC